VSPARTSIGHSVIGRPIADIAETVCTRGRPSALAAAVSVDVQPRRRAAAAAAGSCTPPASEARGHMQVRCAVSVEAQAVEPGACFEQTEMGLWNSIADGGKMSMLRGSDPRCVRSGRVVSDLNGYYDSQNIIAVPIKATQQSSPCPCLVPACDLQTPAFTGTVLSVVLHHSHNHEGGAGLRHVPPAPSTLAGSRCSEISVAGCTTHSATTWASHGQLLGP
jgi:hypothetical protein